MHTGRIKPLSDTTWTETSDILLLPSLWEISADASQAEITAQTLPLSYYLDIIRLENSSGHFDQFQISTFNNFVQ